MRHHAIDAMKAMLRQLLLLAGTRAQITHHLFDSPQRPLLPALPLVFDDGATQQLRLREGDNIEDALAAAGPRTGPAYVERVVRAAHARAHAAGKTLRRRIAIIVASPASRITRHAAAQALWHSALAACAHGASVVVVTDGFSISPEDRATLAAALHTAGCVEASIVVLDEWAGPAAAYVAGAAAITDERAILVFVPWGASLPANVFVAYEKLVRGYGGIVAYAPLPGNALVAVDAGLWRRLPKPDAGYALASGIAAWLAALEDHGDAIEVGWAVRTMTEDASGPPLLELDWDGLIQRDADHFHLSRRHIGAPPLPERMAWVPPASQLSIARHARETRGEGTIAASLCLYDDDRFLEGLVEDLLPRLRHLIISHATQPWRGASRPAGFLRAAATIDRIRRASPMKVSVVTGVWPSEEAQRNAALKIAASLVPKPTHVLVVDGDEFWHPVELDRALALVHRASLTQRISWVRATMATYFKTIRHVVDPPEPLRILWLVEVPPENAVTCGFSEARNWACSSTDPRIDLASEIDALGTFVDVQTARCHHLSYVRTTQELADKLQSFAHADDVRSQWVDTVWRAWDSNTSLEDLHPTHPAAFKRTIRQALYELPPALRRLALADATPSEPALLELGPPPPVVVPIVPTLLPQTEEPTDLQWTTLAPGHFESVLSAADLKTRPKLNIDAAPSLKRCDSDGAPRFVVLVLGEGELDDSTRGVFADAAQSVSDALIELGASSAPVVYCADARLCTAPHEAPFFTVFLGAHHLARYHVDDRGTNRMLWEVQGWPAPETSALYNFERVHDQQLLEAIFPRWSRKGHLWDYSAASVLKLAQLSIKARHVPLGSTASLFAKYEGHVERDLDIVFVGRLNERRSRMLQTLRKHGVPVFHANRDALLFGIDLRETLGRAKVVLSLNYFGDADEWKATRYLPAIAAGAVVVAEAGGAVVEREAWREAVTFVDDVEALAATLQYYARNATARVERTRRAAEVLKERRFAAALRGPVNDLVLGSCRFWRAEDVGDAGAWRWSVGSSASGGEL